MYRLPCRGICRVCRDVTSDEVRFVNNTGVTFRVSHLFELCSEWMEICPLLLFWLLLSFFLGTGTSGHILRVHERTIPLNSTIALFEYMQCGKMPMFTLSTMIAMSFFFVVEHCDLLLQMDFCMFSGVLSVCGIVSVDWASRSISYPFLGCLPSSSALEEDGALSARR